MPNYLKLQSIVLLVAIALFVSINADAQPSIKASQEHPDWSSPYPPFRIAGNLYYVGTEELGCYLITTSNGHILINTGLAESVPVIKKNVEALGFRFSDIRILLTNQVHYDHVGGMAEVKKSTGARMMVDEKDAAVLADGGKSDYAFGSSSYLFSPVKADRLLHDHDTVNLGNVHIIVLHHPGHTKGSCSFLFDVKDSVRSYRVLIANMPTIPGKSVLPGMPTYPENKSDFAHTFNAMRELHFDIWLAAHASQFNMQQKHKPGGGYYPEAFIDRKGYENLLEDLLQQFLKWAGSK